MSKGVLCVFCPWQKLSPGFLVVGTECSWEMTSFVVCLLQLPIGLWTNGKTPNFTMKLDHIWEVNCVPPSLTISSEIPKYLTTWVNKSSAVTKAMGGPVSGMSRRD